MKDLDNQSNYSLVKKLLKIWSEKALSKSNENHFQSQNSEKPGL